MKSTAKPNSNISEKAKEIIRGLDKAYEKMLDFKKQKHTDLIILKDGKIEKIKL